MLYHRIVQLLQLGIEPEAKSMLMRSEGRLDYTALEQLFLLIIRPKYEHLRIEAARDFQQPIKPVPYSRRVLDLETVHRIWSIFVLA